MRFEIHFELPDGTEDMVIVSGQTEDEIREKAMAEVERRGGTNPWSKERTP